jgi:predicted nucleotidyltransferase
MTTAQEILSALALVQSELRTAFKVQEIGVFGSVARGEQKESSDIDVLVGFDTDADLIDLIALSQFLEEHLRHKVDVVPRSALRPEMREQVLREVKYL